MTKKDKRPQPVPGMRSPQGQKKRFNLHIDMPHVDLNRPVEVPEPVVERPPQIPPEPETATERTDVAASDAVSAPGAAAEAANAGDVAPVTASHTVAAQDAVTASRAVSARNGKGLPNGAVTAPGAVAAPGAPTPALAATIEVDFKAGHLQIPNSIVFNLWPLLTPYQRVVYEELYKWTHGFGRTRHFFNQKILAKQVKISERKFGYVIDDLEALGLCRRDEVVHRGANTERGTWIEVILPSFRGEATARRAVTARGTVAARRAVTAQDALHERHEKESNETPDAAAPALSIYEIRTIAARLFEVHRTDPDFSHDRLRELVYDALIGQGRKADQQAVEDAIRGMRL